MLTVRLSAVPVYLQRGDFFLSLDLDGDDEIIVPCYALKDDLRINNVDDLEHALTSLSFWGVQSIPHEVMDSIYYDILFWEDGRFDETFPDLVSLRAITLIVDKSKRFLRAIEIGSKQIVRYLLAKNLRIKTPHNACSEAAKFGHLHILSFLHEHGETIDDLTVSAAFSGGNMECIDYLRRAGLFSGIEKKILTASDTSSPQPQYLSVPTLPTLQYVLSLGCSMTPFLLATAASVGNMEILLFVRARGVPWDEGMVRYAAGNGQLAMLKHLHEEGLELTVQATKFAALKGHVDCLRYACEHGSPYSAYTSKCAARHLHCLQYLHEIGCPWDEATTDEAVEFGALACLKYAVENGCLVRKNIHSFAQERRQLECAQYLLSIVDGGLQTQLLSSHPDLTS